MNRFWMTRIVVSFATSIGTSALLAIPGWAFTLSSSEATFNINHFSVLPLDVTTFHDTNTQAIAADGPVKSTANASALFLTDALNPSSSQAKGSTSSVVSGSGRNYSGLAQSLAQVIGYKFQIGSGETFTFDFKSALNLTTEIDQPTTESATAFGNLSLGLYNATDPTHLTLLDFVTIVGNLETPGNTNSLTVDQSSGFTFSSQQTFLKTLAGGTQAAAFASLQGSFARTFTSPTSLTLVEYSVNEATAAVPEPSSIAASLTGIGLLSIRLWRKSKLNQLKRQAIGDR